MGVNSKILEFAAAGHYKNKKYNMLFGRDEMLTSALITGVCDGDVGSTMNFMTFNLDVRRFWEAGKIAEMQSAQLKTLNVVGVQCYCNRRFWLHSFVKYGKV